MKTTIRLCPSFLLQMSDRVILISVVI